MGVHSTFGISAFWILICLLQAMCVILTNALQTSAAPANEAKRPVTVADCISMRRSTDRLLAHFSPDGQRFAVVLRKGNLERNTNEYSLLLWRTESLFRSPEAEVVLTMSSSSNREAIKDITWLADNEAVTFLGERPGELQQMYTFNTRSRTLTKLTNSQTNVVCYSIASNGGQIAYVAEGTVQSIFEEKTRREGLLVSTQWLFDLMLGRKEGGGIRSDQELFFQSRNDHGRPVKTIGKIAPWHGCPFLSPDGRYILVATQVTDIPDNWKGYTDPLFQKAWAQNLAAGHFSWLKRYELIDTTTGAIRILLDSPVDLNGAAEVAWSPDGHSVVITDIHLPLDNTDGEERKARQSFVFAAEVQVPGGGILKISQEDLRLLSWDARTKQLVFEAGRSNWKLGAKVFFRRNEGKWEKVADSTPERSRPEIVLEEDMNTPPRIVAVHPSTHERAILLDLNPQFTQLRFGRVEEVKWKGTDGHEVKGGLYYPPDYVLGKRYPLVIQTHGFRPEMFWIDGPWTTAFAAQPLAGRGIMVLQADESYADMDTPQEVQREVATVEGAIDHLDRHGVIDRDSVGIIGFSRTCLFVKYMLAKSKYHFAAASITDGLDGGYFQYLVYSRSNPYLALFSEGINGARPFGEGLRAWMAHSPGFNVDKVQAPLRIVAPSPDVLLTEWEWFAALSLLGKPVEMVLMQDGAHVLQKPWDRMVSQQGNVDWFAFWLKDEEDPDPKKKEQYTRWHKLRNQYQVGRDRLANHENRTLQPRE